MFPHDFHPAHIIYGYQIDSCVQALLGSKAVILVMEFFSEMALPENRDAVTVKFFFLF